MAAGIHTLPFPIYGAAFRAVFPILDADGDLVTGAAADTPDTEVSTDCGTFADSAELVEIATNSGMYYKDFTAAEMTGGVVAAIFKTATAGTKTTPLVLYPRRLPSIRSATAQAGAEGTITLDASASADNDAYNGCYVRTTGGTGPGQARLITDYVGSTKVATIFPNWATNPSSDTTFEILTTESVTAHAFSGTAIAATPAVDATKISGDSTAADNLEAFLDGNGITADVDLTARSLTITNDAGVGVAVTGTTDAITATGTAGSGIKAISSGSNGHGLELAGNGTGEGLNSQGGANGNGIEAVGGSNTGHALYLNAAASGHGLYAQGKGTTKHGIYTVGGAITSSGIHVQGGSTSGSALKIIANGENDVGLEISGLGSGPGAKITGGLTGIGLDINGGGTSGAGVAIDSTSGEGVVITAASGPGISATGTTYGLYLANNHGTYGTFHMANAGAGPEINAAAATMAITGSLTGNITGNLSGSVGSVTGGATSANQTSIINALGHATYGLSAIRTQGDSAWITATSVAVSDKTGFKLAADGLAQVTAWTVNITGSLSGSVGSIATGGIVAASFATNSITAAAIKADAVTEIQSGLAQTGADSDTLETLSDQLDAIGGDATAANQTTIIDALGHATYGLSALRTRGDSAWVTATSVAVSDKTGFKLAADGMDSVTLPANIVTASSFKADAVTEIQSGLAQTGADSDTLETLSDQIDAIVAGGATNVDVEVQTFSLED